MDKLRVVVVGAGIYGSNHLAAYTWCPDAELVAVCDLKPENRARVEENYPGVHTYEQLSEALANEEIDVVSVATPDCYHAGPALEAIAAGKDVLVEKPLATTIEDARAIVNAAEEKGVRVAVDYHKRWDPASINLKNQLADPATGAPLRGYMSMDDTIDVPTVWFDWSDNSSPGYFLGTHCYDLARWYMGCEVTEVYAVAQKRLLKGMGVDTLDSIQALLTFENGCHWTIENGWILPHGFAKDNDGRTQIITEHKMLRVDSQNRGLEVFDGEKGRTPNYCFMQKFNGRPVGFGFDPIYDFVRCIRTGEPFVADMYDGLAAELIADAVHKSAATHQIVKVEHI